MMYITVYNLSINSNYRILAAELNYRFTTFSTTITSWLVYNAYVNVFLKFQSDIWIIQWVITFKAKIIVEITVTLETPQ